MSYITIALKRAHKANDDRYLPYREIISARPRRRVRGKKRLILGVCLASLVLLASTAFSLIIYFGQEEDREPGGTPLRCRQGPPRQASNVPRRQPERLAPRRTRPRTPISSSRPGSGGSRRQPGGGRGLLPQGHRGGPEESQRPEQPRRDLPVPKRDKEAIDIFTQLIDVKGDWADPYYNLACLYSRQGDIPKSLWHLKVALWMNKELQWVGPERLGPGAFALKT